MRTLIANGTVVTAEASYPADVLIDGERIAGIGAGLAKMANGLRPVIDTKIGLADIEAGIARLESRQVFGKIVVTF